MRLLSSPNSRRLSPRLYRTLLTSHIVVTGTWLGLAVAKLFFVVLAAKSPDVVVGGALLIASSTVNLAFPPIAILTIISGVLLGIGTRWGVLQHTWVLVKLALTVGVVFSGNRLAEAYAAQSAAVIEGLSSGVTRVTAASAPPAWLTAVAVAHVLMLAAAIAVSVYKPWGKSWFGLRRGSPASGRRAPLPLNDAA
jgi:hypothetical protein